MPDEVDRATDRLLRTATAVNEADLAGPSLLPGWTRGHVLAHLARNADALVNLLTWARTGVVTPAYRSQEQRDADIAAGAPRPLAEQLSDVRESAARFTAAAEEMPADAWAAMLEVHGAPQPATLVVWRRLREVEVHHVDLAAGYRPDDWPEAFSHRLLHEAVADLTGHDEFPPLVLHPGETGHDLTLGEPDGAPTVSGSTAQVAAWLIGRSSGDGLTVDPTSPLPTPPRWR